MKNRFDMLWYIFAASAAFFLLRFFQWHIADLVPFGNGLVVLAGGGALLTLSIVFLFRLVRSPLDKRTRIRVALVGVAAVLLSFTLPATNWAIWADFATHKQQRRQVVALLQRRVLVPNVSYNSDLVSLPAEYRCTSRGGGDVLLAGPNNTNVLFFTYRGVLDNFAGFVYSRDDRPPSTNAFGGNVRQIRHMEEHWYWISSW